MAMQKKNYRQDIDGLRSIAVFLVVLHHAGFQLFSGGYVGVDIFFVISGFLITSIIFKGILDSSFSFATFYVRRIKRLMPALFVVLFVTTIFAVLYLYPSDLKKYASSLLWVIFYAGNFFFWLEHGGYFEGNTQEAPLLHTWSLAVEEQYYLIWPLYLIIGLKIFSPRTFLIVTIGLFIACVLFSQWALNITIGAAYYLLPTRMFELMLGSVLAIAWKDIPKLPQLVMHAISIVGLGLIAYAAFVLNEASSFPGFNALYPTLGAGCILLANREHTGIINRILTFKPFVFIGLISYSLYLWHWPVLVFVRYQAIPMTLPVQVSSIALSILLAWLTWKFVENPIRNNSNTSLIRVADKWLLRPMVLTMVTSFILASQNGLQIRYSETINTMDTALNSLSHKMRPLCHSGFRDAGRSPDSSCRLGMDKGNGFDAFLFGDSHANHMAGFIEVLARDANIQAQDYTLDRCPPIFNFAWGSNSVIAQACQQRNDQVLEFITQNKFDYILLGSSWPSKAFRLHIDGQRITDQDKSLVLIEERFEETIKTIIENGSIPVVFDDVPFLGSNDPKCPIKQEAFNKELDCVLPETAGTFNIFFKDVISRVQTKYPQIIRITVADLICINQGCMTVLDGIPLYSDNDHLNYLGARHLGEIYLRKYPNPLKALATASN